MNELKRYMGALTDYLLHGLEPGGFLCAVLENNLYEAARAADNTSARDLAELALLIQRHTPSLSHGSREAMRVWMSLSDMQRINLAGKEWREMLNSKFQISTGDAFNL